MDYSRASMLLFYVIGPAGVMLTRYALVLDRDPRQQGRAGHRAARVPDRQQRGHQRLRAALSAVEFRAAYRRRGAVDAARAVGDARRSGTQALAADLRQAIDTARTLRPDAVYIVSPWSETVTIDSCVDEFLNIPVEIHLGPERILDRFENVRIAKHGRMASLQLTRAPLSWFERMQKRLLDVTVAAGVLVALSPLLAVVGAR